MTSDAPLGTTTVEVSWSAAEVEAWLSEYEQRYAEITAGWVEVWNTVGEALAGLAAEVGPVMEGLVQDEQALNQEMWWRAAQYVGTHITLDGVPLAELAPHYMLKL